MKGDSFIRISLIIIVVLLALNILLPILSNPPTSYAAKNIEYKVLDLGSNEAISMHGCDSFSSSLENCYEKILNEYSKEGWEYINNVRGAYFIFRR